MSLRNRVISPSSNAMKTRWQSVSFVSPQPLVTCVVGREDIKQNFLIHKNVIDAHSPFLKAAFQSSMAEGQKQTMRLEDIEPETFGLLVNWMYNHEIDKQRCFKSMGEDANNHASTDVQGRGSPDLMPLIKLWSLGQRMVMPALENAAMEVIHSLMDNISDIHIIEIANLACQEEEISIFKGFIVEKLAWTWDRAYLQRLAVNLPTEIIIAVAL
ncbi:hypothetical protein ONS95_014132 [Cadophora gregata]|uniref:uncharacterized protein n=1 Tax=Cadophora gregata TaxID=51156 RepID=UPI0026DD3A7F|nr:uncharacterized protein ONS95_014132 [Cadophora gregata]KAK0113887.1 hypothetical protein ONS96_014738 [Cadophora gregata f. sp. sojae]KAK0114645.1 hypothetical protein ONS95_014132 [Cadophora gregata]